MTLPRWAVMLRAQQRRPVKPRPITTEMPPDMRWASYYKSRLAWRRDDAEDEAANHREPIDKSRAR